MPDRSHVQGNRNLIQAAMLTMYRFVRQVEMQELLLILFVTTTSIIRLRSPSSVSRRRSQDWQWPGRWSDPHAAMQRHDMPAVALARARRVAHMDYLGFKDGGIARPATWQSAIIGERKGFFADLAVLFFKLTHCQPAPSTKQY